MQLRRARPLLGTVVEISVHGASAPVLEAAVARAFGAVARVHSLMSFHLPASDVTRLNLGAALQPVTVAAETLHVLKAAQRMSAASGGAFDITVAPRLVARGHLPAPAPARTSLSANWRAIELLEDGRVAFRAPVWIDLGGIAKGYAVDLAVAMLRNAGAEAGLVNAGGDMRAFGEHAARVALRHPVSGKAPLQLGDLADASIATSANPGDGSGPHIDPAAPDGGGAFASVSVVARQCMIADALTKVVMARGLDAAGLLAQMGAAALVIDAAGHALATRDPLLPVAEAIRQRSMARAA